MGVPKFYRWLSERYPCLSQVVKDHQIPEFDNLYLDMNGIIHPCSHPNDDDPHFRITEEQIFLNIFQYIEVLFRIIKPQKVFFMAVDGVAPRAKMNQQRGRRFRSAREAEASVKKAEQKGEVLPMEARFDSNCITPGTEFMVRLHEQLKYFVNKKISTDPGWQGLQIYLSGHETPGEGEHKIMDFIRFERSQPGYDPNTRHCLYGLDADLIMLGLTSHDPHFSLLREEIRFGKKEKRISNPEDITFHLLHLSLLREYIDLEFVALKEISYGYDLEKIIDDWILMGFLVGNDFVPNLPNFHINHDALPYLWRVYKEVMVSSDGYLHDGGILNLQRFETYTRAIAKLDLETFEDNSADLKWLEGKTSQNIEDDEESELSEVDGPVKLASVDMENMSLNCDTGKQQGKLLNYLEEKGELDDEDDDGDFTKEHEKYKLRYYREKFNLSEDDSCQDIIRELCMKYVEAIQWILHYYFNGVSSWGWYYPFHYAPYVSDIKDFQDHPLVFEMGKPFLPFEQLLAVLPAASKELLPEPFRNLMIMEQSPIIEFYPVDFETDLNGKKQDWEAVVLIPFIDEKRLLEAMEPFYQRLKKSERERNCHTSCMLYTYDAGKTERYTSSLPGVFPDIECCRASCEFIPINKYRLSTEKIIKGLLRNVKMDIYFPGFPTLKHLLHTGELKKAGVKVFQMHSRNESMVLKIDETDEPNLKEICDSLVGKPCYIGWPHLVEAFVKSVSDGRKKYIIAKDLPENIMEVNLTESDASAWRRQVYSEKSEYLERKAIDIGVTHVLIEAYRIQGKKYVCESNGEVIPEKIWSDSVATCPLQVTVKNINVFDEVDARGLCTTVAELFPVDTECFMMAIPHYGSLGKVIEVDSKTNRVRVQLNVVPEPDFISLIINKEDYAENYIPAHIMAKRLGLTTLALAQITGKVLLSVGDEENSSKVDIGLNLKFSKQNKEVLGYARRSEGNWSFSKKTERTISIYQEKFPMVFDVLRKNSLYNERLKVSDVFPDEKSTIFADVEKWLKTLPSHKQKAVSCGSSTLDEPLIRQIEETVEKLKKERRSSKIVKVRVKPSVLYRPMKFFGKVSPDPKADFQLFDRVVNVRTLGVAPFALKGTIVGIHKGKTESEPANYEVLFDEECMGGESLRGSGAFENKLYVIPEWSLLNLSYGDRLEREKRGLPNPLVQAQHALQYSVDPKNGVPAEYKRSRKGAYHQKTWQTSLWSTNRQSPSPSGIAQNNNEQSPRVSYNSLESHSSLQNHQFNSPVNLEYQPLNSQTVKRNETKVVPSETMKEHLSAKGSERTTREMLQLNGSHNSNTPIHSPQTSLFYPDNAFMTSYLPQATPVSLSTSTGMLFLICQQNNWPQPTYSCQPTYSHAYAQYVIAAVCVAGRIFSGGPCVSIEEAMESAAYMALYSFSPETYSRQYNNMTSSPTSPMASTTNYNNFSPSSYSCNNESTTSPMSHARTSMRKEFSSEKHIHEKQAASPHECWENVFPKNQVESFSKGSNSASGSLKNYSGSNNPFIPFQE
ncbi:5'-3' exoribonuclease 1-like isoform X2 [Xenia sp. Carnegie-2017]|uniref:5'-3' exoribonuclease 1-like isoform X2 n=1 Tax=Xenia sp. Carnegie-2017 TaxID=2897299 RepID=UPI001F04E8B1|nr:5'-3' exoribonuclease 1-like isoform X2 [Xenia sp. Carnegie-2017]